MRKRLVFAMLLAAVLLTVGVTTGRRLARGVESANLAPAAETKMDRAGQSPPSVEVAAEAAVVSAVAKSNSAMERVKLYALSEDETALLGATCELQMLAQGTELELNGDQWSALAAVTMDIQTIRHTYEAEIATVKAVEPGRYRVEVPVYSEAGDALRAQFRDALRAELGDVKATEVVEKMGRRLEGHFAGFGLSVQTLDIVARPESGRTGYVVTRTVRYSAGDENGDRVVTRRETHAPDWDVSAGESWDVFLAVVRA
jgi:hypothetical protein